MASTKYNDIKRIIEEELQLSKEDIVNMFVEEITKELKHFMGRCTNKPFIDKMIKKEFGTHINQEFLKKGYNDIVQNRILNLLNEKL